MMIFDDLGDINLVFVVFIVNLFIFNQSDILLISICMTSLSVFRQVNYKIH